MTQGKYIGSVSRGELEVEVLKEPSGHYSFSAVGSESLPFAVDLALLQARSMRGEVNENWRSLLRSFKVMESGVRG